MSFNNQYDDTVSVGEWVGTMLLMLIPVVNIVLLFVWAFGGAKPSKRNFFRAYLLLAVISLGISVIGAIVLMSMGVLDNVFGSLFGMYL